jgi:hypothetical protein
LDNLALVDACMRIVLVHEPRWWVLENPVGRLNKWLGKPAMYFHPHEYGDPYTKKTALWGKFAWPEPNPIEPIDDKRVHHAPDSHGRGYTRAETPPGFARAFFEANP